jgi:hypothetical protein
MLPYKVGLGIRVFGFGDGLSSESVFGVVSGFDFGFRVRVHRDSTRSESAPLPFLGMIVQRGRHDAPNRESDAPSVSPSPRLSPKEPSSMIVKQRSC